MSLNLDHHRGRSKSESVQKSTKYSFICYVANVYVCVVVFFLCPSDVQKWWHIWHSGQVKSDDKLIGFSLGDTRQKAHYTCMLNTFRFFFLFRRTYHEINQSRISFTRSQQKIEKKTLSNFLYPQSDSTLIQSSNVTHVQLKRYTQFLIEFLLSAHRFISNGVKCCVFLRENSRLMRTFCLLT